MIVKQFTDERSGGGSEMHASKNIQYNAVYPVFNTLQPGQTKLTTQLRSVSGTSVGGNETHLQKFHSLIKDMKILN